MMKPKHQRLLWVILTLGLLTLALGLILSAFDDNLVFFYSPTDLQEKTIHPEQRVRAGGLVKKESIKWSDQTVTFIITDGNNDIHVTYSGIVPDLFREGQGAVVEGYFSNNLLKASTVLAKHDENYMPPEVAKTLKEQGVWRHAE